LFFETPVTNIAPAVNPLASPEGAIAIPFSAFAPVGIDPNEVTTPPVVIE
jgi:hypothetical protein